MKKMELYSILKITTMKLQEGPHRWSKSRSKKSWQSFDRNKFSNSSFEFSPFAQLIFVALAWKSNKIIAIITCRCDYQHSHFLFEIFWNIGLINVKYIIFIDRRVIFPVIASNFLHTHLTWSETGRFTSLSWLWPGWISFFLRMIY